MRKGFWRHGPMAAMVMGVGMAVALGGCGSGVKRTASGNAANHTTSARPSVGVAYIDPEVVMCMRRNGMMALSNGELHVSKTLPARKRKAVERRCGYGVASGGQSSEKPATKAAAKPRVAESSVNAAASARSRLVAKIMACLQDAGINIPSHDAALLSSTSGIKTRNPRVKAAIGKCRSEL